MTAEFEAHTKSQNGRFATTTRDYDYVRGNKIVWLCSGRTFPGAPWC